MKNVQSLIEHYINSIFTINENLSIVSVIKFIITTKGNVTVVVTKCARFLSQCTFAKSKHQPVKQSNMNLVEKNKTNMKEKQNGAPILLNPKSYSNIGMVLKHLIQTIDVPNSSQGTFVGCDGDYNYYY